MSKPTTSNINSGNQGWDGVVDDNFDVLANGPLPVFEHTGDESDLESTYAAASHDRCLVWVDHTTLGWLLYASDGTDWAPYGGQQMDNQADSTAVTVADLVTDFNDLLAKLQDTGRMA